MPPRKSVDERFLSLQRQLQCHAMLFSALLSLSLAVPQTSSFFSSTGVAISSAQSPAAFSMAGDFTFSSDAMSVLGLSDAFAGVGNEGKSSALGTVFAFAALPPRPPPRPPRPRPLISNPPRPLEG